MVDAVTPTPQTAAPVAPVPTDVGDKYARLCERLRALLPDGLIIAFSGGIKSAFCSGPPPASSARRAAPAGRDCREHEYGSCRT